MPQFARHFPLLLALALAAGGCAATRSDSASLRLLVQFAAPVTDPAAPALIGELERVTGASIHYLQTVGRGVHVYQLEGPARTLEQAAARLAARPDVRFAEPERRMQPLDGTRAGG